MFHDRRSRILAFLAVALGIAAFVPVARAEEPVLRMKALAVDMSGIGRLRADTLEITIERWSTDDEQKRILDTLVERSPDKLLDVVRSIKPRAGFIRTNTSLGWDIQYAFLQESTEGGRRVIIATDRPMTFYEVLNNPRSRDYEYLLADIRLGADGKGTGRLSTAARVRYDAEAKRIEIEEYGIESVRLTEVTVEGK